MAKQTYGLRMMKRTSNSGNARASKLTPERRSEIARKANAARTSKRQALKVIQTMPDAEAIDYMLAIANGTNIEPYAPSPSPPPAIRGAHTDLNIEILLRGLDKLGFRASQRSVFAEQVMAGEAMHAKILKAMGAPDDVIEARFLGIPIMVDKTIGENQVRFVFKGKVTYMLDFNQ